MMNTCHYRPTTAVVHKDALQSNIQSLRSYLKKKQRLLPL